MKGFISLLVLALWLTPDGTNALPDLLAPFRNMFGMNKPPSSNSGGLKHSNSPSSFIGHGRPFGSGRPESSPDEENPHGFGEFGPGAGPSSSSYHNGPPAPPPGVPYGAYQGQGQRGHSSRPSSSSSRPSLPSSRPSLSSSNFIGGSSRPVRQQPGPYRGYGGRPSSHSGGHSDDEPSPYQGQGGFGGPSSYPPRHPGPGFGGSGSPYQGQGQPQPQSYNPESGQGAGPYPNGPPGGHPADSGYSSDGPSSEGGDRFNGFGSFGGGPPGGEPSNSPSDEDEGPGPFRGSGGGRGNGSGGRLTPFRPSRPAPSYENSPATPQRFPGSHSTRGAPSNGGETPAYFGGRPSDYPEQYEGGQRDTRNPEVISADDAYKYPPQISEDDEERPPGSGFGPSRGFGGRPSSSPGRGAGGSSSSPPFFNQQGSSPFGGPQYPSSTNNGRPLRQRYAGSGNSFSFTKPSQGAYPGGESGESAHYGKPMMMSASAPNALKLHPKSESRRRRRRQRKSPVDNLNNNENNNNIVQLFSPKDPNYRGMGSTLDPVATPYEPQTAATGHGHGGHGGHEGMSNNGDRILYHVSGHKGPYSYRFGYDTGKGYNRLFRFEEKDETGYVKGKYGFHDKHGKLNVVNYEAHPKHGFHAERGQKHHY